MSNRLALQAPSGTCTRWQRYAPARLAGVRDDESQFPVIVIYQYFCGAVPAIGVNTTRTDTLPLAATTNTLRLACYAVCPDRTLNAELCKIILN